MSTPAYPVPVLLQLPHITDARGGLTFVQTPPEGRNAEEAVPDSAKGQLCFTLARIFYLYDVPEGGTRGAHAHLTEQQILIAVAGAFDVEVYDGSNRRTYHLDRPDAGLYVPPHYWRELSNFTPGAVCLTLSSIPFDPDDYLGSPEEYAEFLASRRKK